MSASDPKNRPPRPAKSGWTDEHLPLEVRRELLKHELNTVIAGKKKRAPAAALDADPAQPAAPEAAPADDARDDAPAP